MQLHKFFLSCTNSTCRMFYFFFNDTATTEIYTLSLHDALPISYILDIENLDNGKQWSPVNS